MHTVRGRNSGLLKARLALAVGSANDFSIGNFPGEGRQSLRRTNPFNSGFQTTFTNPLLVTLFLPYINNL